jgi:hypothetical protein
MRGETKQTAFFSGQQKLATVEAVDAFVRTADRGAEFVYCEAREPMRGETWARVGELVQAELVRSHQRRRQGGGFEYFIVRTGKARAQRMNPQQAALADAATATILQILKRAANVGADCPSDAELARQVGLSTRILAQNRVRRLIEVGLIESTVAHEGGVPRRVVTIVETGRRTKLPPKWAALEAAARNDSQAAGNAVPRTNPAAPPAR